MPRNITTTARILAAIAEESVHQTAYPQHGDIAPLRANHLRVTDRPFASESTDAAQRAEDSYRALTTSTVARKRTKKGNTSTVRRYGQSLVAGDTDAYGAGSIVPVSVLSHALEECRTIRHADGREETRYMADAIGVARVASLAFDIPPLLGGEFLSFSEELPAEVSTLLDWNVTGSTGAYMATNETKLTYAPRLRLPSLRLRKGEKAEETVTFHDGQSVTRLASPSVDRDHAFMGHRAYVRPSTVRQVRASRAVVREAFTLNSGDPLASLAAVAGIIGKGDKVRFATADRSIVGTLTRGKGGKYSATIPDGPTVKGARTVAAIVKALAPAFP